MKIIVDTDDCPRDRHMYVYGATLVGDSWGCQAEYMPLDEFLAYMAIWWMQQQELMERARFERERDEAAKEARAKFRVVK